MVVLMTCCHELPWFFDHLPFREIAYGVDSDLCDQVMVISDPLDSFIHGRFVETEGSSDLESQPLFCLFINE